MKSRLLYALWIVVFLAGCSRVEPTPLTPVAAPISASDALSQAENYEKTECPNNRFMAGGSVECGVLSVPLDRQQMEGPKIKLSVTVVHSTAEEIKPDPVVFVSYGGSAGYAFIYRNNITDRDLVLVDPRGVGRSEPDLSCPDAAAVAGKTLNQPPYDAAVLEQVRQAQQSCYQKWSDQGVDLSLLSSSAAAADLEDLRQALGYERWNVYASGYGARVALLMMRDFPQTIRSVVIDSPAAVVGEDLAGQAANADRVLNQFFESCAADEFCGEAFPELKTVFYEVADRLNGSPIQMEVADLNAGKRYQVLVDGDRLIEILIRAISSGNGMILPEMPRAIYQLKSGKFDYLAGLLGNMTSSFSYSSSGMQWQVECTELLPQISSERLQQSLGGVDAQLSEYFSHQMAAYLNTCDILKDVKPSQGLEQVPASDIPALVMYGDRNLSSSPDWAKRISSSLSRSFLVEVTGGTGGFDRMRGNCSRGLVTAFLNDPATQPDITCTKEEVDINWITLQ